jgi:hypothetical protein
VNPKIAAIIAITKKIAAHFSITFVLPSYINIVPTYMGYKTNRL